MNSDEKLPNPEEVRLIYKDTYNFYTKWIAAMEPNWDEVIADSRVIEHRYPFELCQKILVEVVAVIEASCMSQIKGGNMDGG